MVLLLVLSLFWEIFVQHLLKLPIYDVIDTYRNVEYLCVALESTKEKRRKKIARLLILCTLKFSFHEF